jgi:hypothetical protein
MPQHHRCHDRLTLETEAREWEDGHPILGTAHDEATPLLGRLEEQQLLTSLFDDVALHGYVVRVQDGWLAEHWDVWDKEATKDQSLSGLRMYGDEFPVARV